MLSTQKTSISQRMRHARVAAGMTQDEVVDALAGVGVRLTKGGLSKYERGGSTPKPTILRALGKVLAVEPSYFLEEPSLEMRWLKFRKLSRMSKTRQERVKALAASEVEVLLTLCRALEPTRDEVALTPTTVRSPEDAEKAAMSLRAKWKLGDQPIESVTATIEDGGGLVVESPCDDDVFDGLSGWANESVPVVVVSSDVSDDRRRFSLAHELGHLFMDVRDVNERTEENLAHRFAASFLVTAATARRELGVKRRHLDFRELAMLKQKHGLSMQAWILRAADLAIIERSHAHVLLAEMSSRGWRRHEPVQFEGKERPLKPRQLTMRALAEGLLTLIQAERICPGVTRGLEDIPGEPPGALDARTLVRLPKDERDRLMEQGAAMVADEYEKRGELAGFETLSEGGPF